MNDVSRTSFPPNISMMNFIIDGYIRTVDVSDRSDLLQVSLHKLFKLWVVNRFV